jgi:hypothetical protein
VTTTFSVASLDALAVQIMPSTSGRRAQIEGAGPDHMAEIIAGKTLDAFLDSPAGRTTHTHCSASA